MNETRYQNLTRLRRKKHLSMSYMAEKLKISTAYYCQLETKKKRLSYEMAIKIAKVLDLMPDDVFYEDEKKSLRKKELSKIQ